MSANKQPSAEERAALIWWSDAARKGRAEARAQGVHGDLSYLNETVLGRRGKAAPKQTLSLADAMAAAEVPEDTAIEVMAVTSREIVKLAYRAWRERRSGLRDRREPGSAA